MCTVLALEENTTDYELQSTEQLASAEVVLQADFEYHIIRTSSMDLAEQPTRDSSEESDVYEPPAFIQALPEQLYTEAGDDLYLKCIVRGNPMPVISWKRNGNLLPSSK